MESERSVGALDSVDERTEQFETGESMSTLDAFLADDAGSESAQGTLDRILGRGGDDDGFGLDDIDGLLDDSEPGSLDDFFKGLV